jgi:hypothetical protein
MSTGSLPVVRAFGGVSGEGTGRARGRCSPFATAFPQNCDFDFGAPAYRLVYTLEVNHREKCDAYI